MASSTKSLTSDHKPIAYKLQMKLVQIMPPDSQEYDKTLHCTKRIEIDNLNAEALAMFSRFMNKVKEQAIL